MDDNLRLRNRESAIKWPNCGLTYSIVQVSCVMSIKVGFGGGTGGVFKARDSILTLSKISEARTI